MAEEFPTGEQYPGEKENREPTPVSHTLDVVLIDGRFAQVAGVGTETSFVIFLDGKVAGSPGIDHIDWQEYKYEKPPLGPKKFVKGWKEKCPKNNIRLLSGAPRKQRKTMS